MTKSQYLDRLSRHLSFLTKEEREDILYDYEEHFSVGLNEGKSESEIIESLGNPSSIARQFRANYMVNIAEANTSTSNILRAIIATIGLSLFNLIFVLGPFLAILGVLIGLFAVSIGFVIGGIGLFASPILTPIFHTHVHLPSVFTANRGGIIFFGIGLTSLGSLFFIGICYLSKFLYKLTIEYLKLNLRIINK